MPSSSLAVSYFAARTKIRIKSVHLLPWLGFSLRTVYSYNLFDLLFSQICEPIDGSLPDQAFTVVESLKLLFSESGKQGAKVKRRTFRSPKGLMAVGLTEVTGLRAI